MQSTILVLSEFTPNVLLSLPDINDTVIKNTHFPIIYGIGNEICVCMNSLVFVAKCN